MDYDRFRKLQPNFNEKNKFNIKTKSILFFYVFIIIVMFSDFNRYNESPVKAKITDSNVFLEDLYPIRDNWFPVQGTDSNVSHYVYNDINRNGVYDVGDRPLAGIAVRMIRPDNTYTIRRSNIRGFVNFTNSLTASPVDVWEEGEFSFEVIIPKGWELTSKNAIQKVNYRTDVTTRPGLIADKVPEPTGISLIPTINGKISVRTENGDLINANINNVSVTAISPEGKEQTIPIDESGLFSFEGKIGEWKLRVKHLTKNNVYERIINVKHGPVYTSNIIIGDDEKIIPKKNVTVVDFEDITQSIIAKIPNKIAGLSWNNLIAVDNELYGGQGYINGTISGKYVGYSTSGYPVTISNENGFDFYGGYFSVAWFDAEGEKLKVRAWQKDKLIADEEYTLSALRPFWLDAKYYNITKLELSTEHYWQFVVDDILVGL